VLADVLKLERHGGAHLGQFQGRKLFSIASGSCLGRNKYATKTNEMRATILYRRVESRRAASWRSRYAHPVYSLIVIDWSARVCPA